MGRKNITVTVVVPAFNEEKYISECLDALEDQSYPIEQIIVVDNNSSDKTREIVSKYVSINLLQEKRQHQAFARQLGFNAARTDYVATVDADTIASKDWLKSMVAGLESQNVAAISSYTVVRDVSMSRKLSVFISSLGFMMNKIAAGHYGLYGSSFLIKRRVWNEVEGSLHLDPSVWEDVDLAAACDARGYELGLVKEPLVSTSLRRGQSSPTEIYRYLRGWSKAFGFYSKYSAALIWFFSIFVLSGLVFGRVFFKAPKKVRKISNSAAGAAIR